MYGLMCKQKNFIGSLMMPFHPQRSSHVVSDTAAVFKNMFTFGSNTAFLVPIMIELGCQLLQRSCTISWHLFQHTLELIKRPDYRPFLGSLGEVLQKLSQVCEMIFSCNPIVYLFSMAGTTSLPSLSLLSPFSNFKTSFQCWHQQHDLHPWYEIIADAKYRATGGSSWRM